MAAGQLPPVPDPTGQPRPPAAPRVVGAWQGEHYQLTVRHHQAADELFVGPTGQRHPLLESVGARPPRGRRTAALGAAYTVLPVTVLIAALLWFTTDRGAGVYLILVAVAVAVTGLFFWRNASGTTVVLRAGARAVAEVDIDGAGLELPLYELRSISARDTSRGLALRLVGPNKQRLTLPLGLLEANQQLWDLVYNGIRHSEAAGAEFDAHTRQLLSLPPPRDA